MSSSGPFGVEVTREGARPEVVWRRDAVAGTGATDPRRRVRRRLWVAPLAHDPGERGLAKRLLRGHALLRRRSVRTRSSSSARNTTPLPSSSSFRPPRTTPTTTGAGRPCTRARPGCPSHVRWLGASWPSRSRPCGRRRRCPIGKRSDTSTGRGTRACLPGAEAPDGGPGSGPSSPGPRARGSRSTSPSRRISTSIPRCWTAIACSSRWVTTSTGRGACATRWRRSSRAGAVPRSSAGTPAGGRFASKARG